MQKLSWRIYIGDLLARSLQQMEYRRSLARPLDKIPLQDLFANSLYEISVCTNSLSWQDLCRRPLGQISATDLLATSLYKISISGGLAKSVHNSTRGLLARLFKRSLYELSKKLVLARCPEISYQDLCTRSPYHLSVQNLCANSLQETSRCLHKISWTMDMSQKPFCLENLRESAGRVARGQRFV